MRSEAEFRALFPNANALDGDSYSQILRLGEKILETFHIPYILYKSNAAVSRDSTNTTGTGGLDDDETFDHLSFAIPPGILRPNSSILVSALWRSTSSANVKTLECKLDSTSLGTKEITTNVANQIDILIHSDNLATEQKAVADITSGFHGAAATMQDPAVDMTVERILTLNSKWAGAVASENITLEHCMLIVYPGV